MSHVSAISPRAQQPRVSTIRLSSRTRKIVLLAHIAAAGAWLGIDLVLGLLVLTAVTSPDPAQTAAFSIGIAAFATWPLITVGLLTLGTGVILGLGSKYGLTRYRWVLVKLVLNVALVTVATLVLRPGVEELAATAGAALAGGDGFAVGNTMLFPPVVSSTAVLFAMVLSVFKPWGRTIRSAAAHEGGGTMSPMASRGGLQGPSA